VPEEDVVGKQMARFVKETWQCQKKKWVENKMAWDVN